ncbi:Uncharacterized protein OBRU01_09307 [Operophtera brumata]|uniref:Uncharacterized protein n=1 Tax=Operophtera brumata TaxID=104452 RepID=A0A0L7LFZ2_OPEBR|nr:Uncharacterized protein OBRU01_09307 [Operophtera brumata]
MSKISAEELEMVQFIDSIDNECRYYRFKYGAYYQIRKPQIRNSDENKIPPKSNKEEKGEKFTTYLQSTRGQDN